MPMAFIFLPLIARFLLAKEWKLFIFGMKFSEWRIYLLAGNTLNFLVLLLVLLLPESPKFLVSVGRKADALGVLKLIYATNTGSSRDVSETRRWPVLRISFCSSGALTGVPSARRALGEPRQQPLGNEGPDERPPPDLEADVADIRAAVRREDGEDVLPDIPAVRHRARIVHVVSSGARARRLTNKHLSDSSLRFPDFFNQLQTHAENGTAATLCSVVGREHHNQTAVALNDCDGSGNMRTYDIIFLIGITFTSLSLLISFYIEKIGQNNYVCESARRRASSDEHYRRKELNVRGKYFQSAPWQCLPPARFCSSM